MFFFLFFFHRDLFDKGYTSGKQERDVQKEAESILSCISLQSLVRRVLSFVHRKHDTPKESVCAKFGAFLGCLAFQKLQSQASRCMRSCSCVYSPFLHDFMNIFLFCTVYSGLEKEVCSGIMS